MATEPNSPLNYILTVLRSPEVDGVNLKEFGFSPTSVDYKILEAKAAAEVTAGYGVSLLKREGRKAFLEGIGKPGLFGAFAPSLAKVVPERTMKHVNEVYYMESKLPRDVKNIAHFFGERKKLTEALSPFVPRREGTGGDSLTDLQTILRVLDYFNFEKIKP